MLFHALSALVLAASPAQDETAPGAIDSTPVIQAVFDGRTELLTRAEYRDWLLSTQPEGLALRYVQAATIHEKTVALGIEVSDADVAERTRAEIDERIEQAFGGDREAWIDELKRLDRTPDGLLRQRQVENRMQLEAEAVSLHERTVTPEGVEAEWRKRYGPGGLSWKVTALAVRLLQPSPPDDTPPAVRQRLRREAREELEGRMQGLYERLQDGADFETLRKQYTDDPAMLESNGTFPRGFPTPDWPRDHLEEIQDLPVGAFAPPVYARGAYHILRIDERTVKPLEEVAAEIEADLQSRPPDAGEVLAALGRAATEAEWEVSAAMFAAGPQPDGQTVLVLEGRNVSRRELGDWILSLVAESNTNGFVEHALIARLAAEAGCTPTPEAVEERARLIMDHLIETIFMGRVDRFLQEMKAGSVEDYLRKQVPIVTHALETECLMLRERQVSENEVRALWKERYGPAGRALSVRMIELEMPALPEGLDAQAAVLERNRLFAETEAQGRRLVERLENGEDFASLARRHSVHANREVGGVLGGNFTGEGWPQAVAEPVLAGRRGAFVGPVGDGPTVGKVWIFELLEERDVPFESVAEGLRAELARKPPSDGDRSGWVNVFLRRVELERLPALYE